MGKATAGNFQCCQNSVYAVFLKKETPNYPSLTFDGTKLALVTEHIHLGITLNSRLTWHSQVNKITTKAFRVVNMLKRIRHLVPRLSAECAYRTLVLPVMEYSNVVYDNLTNDLSNKLENVQRAAALMCTGAYRRTSYEKLLAELGWETLKLRRKYQPLVLMHKIHNGLTPNYLSSMIPLSCSQRSNYVLRNANNYSLPFCRNERYKQSFVPSTLSEWNDLPTHIRGIPAVYTFKKELKKVLFANRPNKLYQIGSLQANRYHTWLRLGLSPLKDHLSTHHIVECDLCPFCLSEPETTLHFLCTCPTYNSQCLQLISSLADILGNEVYTYSKTMLTRLLLYGNEDLSFHINNNIFEATQMFLIKSKCFCYVNS